jgi:ABC-2 type transport system ATP-binding protein
MPTNDIVIVENLEKRFGDFVAVNKISLRVAKGSVYGFLGPNGAGKSTTIRMLCGILTPSGGTGTINGFDIYTQTEKIKACIGYMSQKFSLYEDLTVEENIDFYNGIYRVPEEKKQSRKEWVIEMANLQSALHRKTGTLPVGWKQRLALGCAVLHEPSILFLDEPTAGVDPISRRRFWKLIYELSGKGVTIFVTTHYMEEAEYFNEIALIYRGDLIAQGSPEKLKKESMKESVFEILCSDPQNALEILYTQKIVEEVSFFGKGLRAIVNDEEFAKGKIIEILNKSGIEVSSIEPVLPSLEEVFVSLIEDYDRKHRAQQEVSR